MTARERLKEARRQLVATAWVLVPAALAMPLAAGAALWRWACGAAPPEQAPPPPEPDEPAVSPYCIAAPPAWMADVPEMPLPGPPTPIHK